MATDRSILTGSQGGALEKKRFDDEAVGEIEMARSGYRGSPDTLYVGTLTDVRRIYQGTFVDTYSKMAAAKLYTTKTLISADALRNDRVLPLFE